MSEDGLITEWIAMRRESPPEIGSGLGDDVMSRVRAAAAEPSLAERIETAARRWFPARRPGWVYLGGSAFAGASRVLIILYLVLGIC